MNQIKGEFKYNYNLAHLSWFKVGGVGEVFFKPYDNEDLRKFLQINHMPITILGAGSNIIIRDGGIKGVIIKLGQNFTNINLLENKIEVGAGCLNINLAKFCQRNLISGFEFLIGIPGSIGGGVIMNAGAYRREFKDIIAEIETIDFNGNIIRMSIKDIVYNYRKSNIPNNLIITKVYFKYNFGRKEEIDLEIQTIKTKRLQTQPIYEKTGGSTFANPLEKELKAWQLIDQAGLRGYAMGGARMSELHCNFMINDGTASAKDLENLGEHVRKTVLLKTGINLQWEIRKLGNY